MNVFKFKKKWRLSDAETVTGRKRFINIVLKGNFNIFKSCEHLVVYVGITNDTKSYG